jgi:hypothetical protein
MMPRIEALPRAIHSSSIQVSAATGDGERQVVRRHVLGAVADALAEHERAHEAGDAGVDVHDGAAGEIERAACAEPAAAPHPVRDRRVDDDAPEDHEQHHRREFHAVDIGADDEGRGDDRERHLEHDEHGLGNRVRRRGHGLLQRIDRDAFQEELRHVADVRAAAGEGEAIADDDPNHRRDAGGGEDVHHHREHVLLAHHAAVEEGDAGNRHQQHERRRGQHPGGVAGVELGLRRLRLFLLLFGLLLFGLGLGRLRVLHRHDLGRRYRLGLKRRRVDRRRRQRPGFAAGQVLAESEEGEEGEQHQRQPRPRGESAPAPIHVQCESGHVVRSP